MSITLVPNNNYGKKKNGKSSFERKSEQYFQQLVNDEKPPQFKWKRTIRNVKYLHYGPLNQTIQSDWRIENEEYNIYESSLVYKTWDKAFDAAKKTARDDINRLGHTTNYSQGSKITFDKHWGSEYAQRGRIYKPNENILVRARYGHYEY